MHKSFSRLLEAFRNAVGEAAHGEREMQTLGDLVGASSQTLTNWKTRGVSKQGALAASKAFGCSAAFILDGIGGLQSEPMAISEVRLTLGSHAMLMAQAVANESEEERALIAQQVAYMLRHGPSERISNAIDALTSVNVVIPPMGDERTAADSERVELHSPRAERAAKQTGQDGGGKPWDSTSQGRSITPPTTVPGSQPVHRVPGQSTARKRSAKP